MPRYFLAFLLFIAAAAPVRSQWVQTSGPEGGAVVVFFADGGTLFAGTFFGGLYRSTDGAVTWEHSFTGFGYQSVTAVARCGAYLFAAGTEGLYRSSDDGDSWSEIPGFDLLGGVATLAVQGGHIIAGTSEGGVYASTDTGSTWNPSNTGLPNSSGTTWVPAAIAAGWSYIITAGDFSGSGVFRSVDLGTTWSPADSGLPSGDLYGTYHYDGGVLFTAGADIHRSTDLGVSWKPASGGIFPYTASRAVASHGGKHFASGGWGLFSSTDTGTSWSPVTGGLPVMEIASLASAGSDFFAGTMADGVYKSTDGGSTWNRANPGLRAREVTGFVADGAVLYANARSVFATTDDGTAWTEVRGDLRDSAAMPTLVYADGDTLIVFDGTLYSGLGRSFDGGLTWASVWPELATLGAVRNIVRTGAGLLTVAGAIYRSTDNGTSWASVDSALTASAYLFSVERLNGSLFAFGTGIFRSTDDGATWEDATPGAPGFTQADYMAAAGGNLFAADRFAGAIYRSTNNGTSWTQASTPGGAASIDHLHGSGSVLLATSAFLGVYLSTNAGSSWSNITPGLLPDEPSYAVALHNGSIFCGTGGNSVWRRPLSQVTGVAGDGPALPAATRLSRNYPNPFNPSTAITIDLREAARVSLRVYDILGREVDVLVDGRLDAGTHSIVWDAGGLPSGVYHYTLRAGVFHESKRMILVR